MAQFKTAPEFYRADYYTLTKPAVYLFGMAVEFTRTGNDLILLTFDLIYNESLLLSISAFFSYFCKTFKIYRKKVPSLTYFNYLYIDLSMLHHIYFAIFNFVLAKTL